MWERTGETLDAAARDVTLHEVTSDSGEGDAWEVELRGRVIGRVQEYDATARAGVGFATHEPRWAFTPTSPPKRWGTSAGLTIFGFRVRDEAVGYGVRYHS